MLLRTTLMPIGVACCAAVASVAGEVAAVADVEVAPPPPRTVVVSPRRVGYVWAPGYWRCNGTGYRRVDGRWVRERRG